MTEAQDKTAVAETVYKYATAIDNRDWELYRSIFADTVMFDFTSYAPRLQRGEMSAEKWISNLKPLFTGLAATQHSMSNPSVYLRGNQAKITMRIQAHHIYDENDPASWFTIGGYYYDTLTKTKAENWLLTGVTLNVLWRSGNPAIMKSAETDGIAALKKTSPRRLK